MTRGITKRSRFAAGEARRIRCIKIVKDVYWNGSASAQELCATLSGLPGITDTDASTVEQDLVQLQRQGLPISVSESGRWRIDATIPGFDLRLTKAEASVVWAWCIARGSSDLPLPAGSSSEEQSVAVSTLLSGLRQFHKGSEVMSTGTDNTTRTGVSNARAPVRRVQASELIGEARLVFRRLRIVDLIEDRKALNTTQLAAALDVSQRTAHDDLNFLRCSGFDIRFQRRFHEFRIEGLNSFLADHLTSPMAFALLDLLEPPNSSKRSKDRAATPRVALKKLQESIRVLVTRMTEDVPDLTPS